MSTLRTRKNRLSGFTLLEVVIVLGIFVVMLFALVEFFIHYNTSFSFTQASVSTASSANAILNAVETYGMPADQVLASHVFASGTLSSGTTALILELPSIDASGNIIGGTYDYVAIYQSGTSAYAVVSPNAASSRRSATKTLATNLQTLTFTYDSASFPSVTKVIVDVQTQTMLKSQAIGSHVHETIYLRNTSS